MTLEERIQGLRLRALYRAVELGNASQLCRELGISRSLFYRWKKRFYQYGPEGLHPRRRGCRRGRPPKVEAHEERAVLGMALSWPTWGPRRLSAQLQRSSVRVAPSTIHRLLRRTGLGSRHERLAVLEHHSARSAGLLTDRTRRRLWQARYGRARHVEAKTPGELVCLDCFYIGKLKGVGKLWQVTACDAACSFAFAQVIPSVEAIHCARFLKRVLLPAYRNAGWKLKRVLTDHGSEFKGLFDALCSELGIRHTRTKPRHCWTNGFVERLQGTILHEHWRVAFRRRYFTSAASVDRSLQSFLAFYNHQRPHQGYRLAGRVPAEIFLGAVQS